MAITISRHFSRSRNKRLHRCTPNRFTSFSAISYRTILGISSPVGFHVAIALVATIAIAAGLRARTIVHSDRLRSFPISSCSSSTNFPPTFRCYCPVLIPSGRTRSQECSTRKHNSLEYRRHAANEPQFVCKVFKRTLGTDSVSWRTV